MSRGWNYGEDEKEEDKLNDAQLFQIKRKFIASKTKQLKKDKKYGFKLSEIDQKIKRPDIGAKVDMLRA